MKIGQYAKVADTVADATVPSAAPSGVVAAAKTAGQTVDQTAEDEELNDQLLEAPDESTSEFIGPLQPPEGRPWSEDYQRQAALLGDVATRAAERRAHLRAPIVGPHGQPTTYVSPEDLTRESAPWGGEPEGSQLEEQLRKIPPTESAVPLAGVGPGTEEQPLVKYAEPGYRTSAPGPTGTVDRAKALSEPWWSPLHVKPGRGLSSLALALDVGPLRGGDERPEGTSWFIPPEPDTAGFDKVKVREKLLAPVTSDISGKTHFGRTKGVKPEGAVFSEGDISLPRLAEYHDALVAEQAEVYARYAPEHGPLEPLSYRPDPNPILSRVLLQAGDLSYRPDSLLSPTASTEKELRRLDADIKRVEELKAVLEKIAAVAGISEDEIGDAIKWQGAPEALRRPEGE